MGRLIVGGKLRVGQVFRYASAKDPVPPTIDGYANFHQATHSPGLKRALLESGINGDGQGHRSTASVDR